MREGKWSRMLFRREGCCQDLCEGREMVENAIQEGGLLSRLM